MQKVKPKGLGRGDNRKVKNLELKKVIKYKIEEVMEEENGK
ncbi:hypothetical protein [Emticicia fontis]